MKKAKKIFSKAIFNKTIKSIKNSKYFSISFDEGTDVSILV